MEGYPILNLSHASVDNMLFLVSINSDKDHAETQESRLLDPELRRVLRSEVSRLVRNMPTKEHKKQGIGETIIRVIMRGLPKNDEIHRLLGVISQAADSFDFRAVIIRYHPQPPKPSIPKWPENQNLLIQ